MTAPDAVPPQEAIEAAAIKMAFGTIISDERATEYWNILPRGEQERWLARAEAALAAAYPAIRAQLRSEWEAEIRQSFDTSVVPDICFHEDECTEDHCPCDDAGGDR